MKSTSHSGPRLALRPSLSHWDTITAGLHLPSHPKLPKCLASLNCNIPQLTTPSGSSSFFGTQQTRLGSGNQIRHTGAVAFDSRRSLASRSPQILETPNSRGPISPARLFHHPSSSQTPQLVSPPSIPPWSTLQSILAFLSILSSSYSESLAAGTSLHQLTFQLCRRHVGRRLDGLTCPAPLVH